MPSEPGLVFVPSFRLAPGFAGFGKTFPNSTHQSLRQQIGREKDLAKRFYVLLHLFLKRRYEKVDIVFIRHTHDAQEVDEQTFFYSRQSGGTIVSTALEKMLEIQKERYATADWNIYAAQASDGYTQSGDAKRCVELLESELMPICQYYAYIEILDERETLSGGKVLTGFSLPLKELFAVVDAGQILTDRI